MASILAFIHNGCGEDVVRLEVMNQQQRSGQTRRQSYGCRRYWGRWPTDAS